MSQEVMNELVNMSQEIIKLKDRNRELLEVLRIIAAFATGGDDTCEVIAKRARAAISKAEGGDQ